jgi:hypothetical protein
MNMADKEVKFSFRLPESLYYKLHQQATTDGTTVSDVVRTIIVESKRIESVSSKIDELEISRRFRELYTQARLANIGIDAIAQVAFGDKYNIWRTGVDRNFEQEKAKKKSTT